MRHLYKVLGNEDISYYELFIPESSRTIVDRFYIKFVTSDFSGTSIQGVKAEPLKQSSG